MYPIGIGQPKLFTIFIGQVMDRAVRMYFDRVTLLLDMLQETEEEERLVDARCQDEDTFAPPDTNGALSTHPKGLAGPVAYIESILVRTPNARKIFRIVF